LGIEQDTRFPLRIKPDLAPLLRMSAAAAPALLAQFRHDAAHQYTILEIALAVLADAERLAETHGLRAYDAVQVAAAADLHRDRSAHGLSRLTLISADQELNAAAAAEGIDVDDPTAHP
jgi:uncharacterized protein